jgi:hypothetical protein
LNTTLKLNLGTSISSRTTVTKVNEQNMERGLSFIVFPLESEVGSSGHGMTESSWILLTGLGFCLLSGKGCVLVSDFPITGFWMLIFFVQKKDFGFQVVDFWASVCSFLIPMLEGSHVLISRTLVAVLSWLQLSWLALRLDGFGVIL